MKTTILTLLPFLHVALAAPVVAPPGTCAAIGIITARASTELPGEGMIGSLAGLIQQRSTQTVSRTSIVYPAVLNPYPSSVARGVTAMKEAIRAAVQRCPEQRIVLLGYSQGAQVISDTLGGGGGGNLGGPVTAPLEASLGSKIAAGILMGDPRYSTADESYLVGTCRQDGIYPRPSTQSADAYEPLLQTICDNGDPYCCSGNNLFAHLGYTQKYNTGALAFVLSRIGG